MDFDQRLKQAIEDAWAEYHVLHVPRQPSSVEPEAVFSAHGQRESLPAALWMWYQCYRLLAALRLVRVELNGLKPLAPGTSRIIVGNHVGKGIDGLLIVTEYYRQTGRLPQFLVDMDHVGWLVRWLVKAGGVIPKQQGGTTQTMVEFLKQPGRILAIFATGDPRERNHVGAVHSSIARAALQNQAEIEPFAQDVRLPLKWTLKNIARLLIFI